MERSLLERMCEVLEHRGPDSRGIHLEDGVGLGVQRLAIIDLESGDQPIFNEDRSVVVVLNGEIYNYRELRSDLSRRGHRFATRSDTEVIVHLYEDHGDACVEYLRGMFAFALWDSRRRRLLVARDRVGKKPLFYAHTPTALLFASEPRAIFQDPAVPRDVDWHAIDAYLHLQYVPHPRSAFAALRKLPPAHLLTCEEGGSVAVRRYWKLSYRDARRPLGEAELSELIREQLLEATSLRLRSDVPVGAFLSGGIDSSAVVSAMARLAPGQVKTFSIGFDDAAFDETSHAREVARLHGTDHHELELGPEAMEVLPRLVWHHGEPFADASAIATMHLAELAARHIRVALNGDGGDESFAGYERYLGFAGEPRLSRRARLRRWLAGGTPDLVERYAARLSHFTDPELVDLYDPGFLESLGERRWRSALEEPFRSSDAATTTDRLLDVDVHSYLPGDLLVKMDIASMAHSLEVRSPLLDQELMATVAALPAEAKLGGEVTKRCFKAALRPWLPDSVLDRPKMGFGVPIGRWFAGRLRGMPEEILLDPGSLSRGVFSERALTDFVRDSAARAGERVDGFEYHANRLWAFLELELWLRTYIDRAPPRAPMAISAG